MSGMDSDEPTAPNERKPTTVLLALALLGLLAALWVSPTLGYWSETALHGPGQRLVPASE